MIQLTGKKKKKKKKVLKISLPVSSGFKATGQRFFFSLAFCFAQFLQL